MILPSECISLSSTEELMTLLVCLTDQAVTHVAMESTGVYWKPVWHILSDDDFVMVLANAAHVKNVPGRKTDVNIKLDSVVTDLLGLSGRGILDALVKGRLRPRFWLRWQTGAFALRSKS
jgi:transposase